MQRSAVSFPRTDDDTLSRFSKRLNFESDAIALRTRRLSERGNTTRAALVDKFCRIVPTCARSSPVYSKEAGRSAWTNTHAAELSKSEAVVRYQIPILRMKNPD
jgi:hypothetical protein